MRWGQSEPPIPRKPGSPGHTALDIVLSVTACPQPRQLHGKILSVDQCHADHVDSRESREIIKVLVVKAEALSYHFLIKALTMWGRNYCSHFTDGDTGARQDGIFLWPSALGDQDGRRVWSATQRPQRSWVFPLLVATTVLWLPTPYSPSYGVPVWPKWVWLCTSTISHPSPLRLGYGAVPWSSCLPALKQLSDGPFHGLGRWHRPSERRGCLQRGSNSEA